MAGQHLTLLLSIAYLRCTLLRLFFFPQTTFTRYPSRIRHNGDKGADVQQGPLNRFLFRLSPCVNLFYCLLLFNHPMGPYPHRILPFLAFRHDRLMHIPGNTGFIMKGHSSAHFLSQSLNTFGSVRRHEFGLICISSESCLWSNVGFARLLGLPP